MLDVLVFFGRVRAHYTSNTIKTELVLVVQDDNIIHFALVNDMYSSSASIILTLDFPEYVNQKS